MRFNSVTLSLPNWVELEFAETALGFPTIEERMKLVLRLAQRNIEEKTGGPFGAAVFEIESGKLISAGVNIVVPSKCSLAHAEAMALMLAEQSLGTYNLAAGHLPGLELVTSAQPCIQCFGNIWWSGIERLIIGAASSDVESITGFKEGPIPANWVSLLENRTKPLKPIRVIRGLMAEESKRLLKRYAEQGGEIYNAT